MLQNWRIDRLKISQKSNFKEAVMEFPAEFTQLLRSEYGITVDKGKHLTKAITQVEKNFASGKKFEHKKSAPSLAPPLQTGENSSVKGSYISDFMN